VPRDDIELARGGTRGDHVEPAIAVHVRDRGEARRS